MAAIHTQGPMSYRILLVDPCAATTAAAEHALVGAGYRAAAVTTFDQALRQVALDRPDVLISAIRLAAFNGLHLLIRVRVEHADLPVIVTGHMSDFTNDAARFGASAGGGPHRDDAPPSPLRARSASSRASASSGS